MTDIFGTIKTGTQLEQAIADTLRAWFPTYLRELEYQLDLPTDALPTPGAYTIAEELDTETGSQLPALIILSPGLAGRPKQEGDGTFRAFFNVGIGIIVSANNRPDTKKLVRLYTAVARTIMLQKQALGGAADGTAWLDESYDDNFPFADEQTISAGTVIFEVEVANVVSRYGGPAVYQQPDPEPDPVTQPGEEWPEATSVTATVEVKES